MRIGEYADLSWDCLRTRARPLGHPIPLGKLFSPGLLFDIGIRVPEYEQCSCGKSLVNI